MKKLKRSKDPSRDNLIKLISLYNDYRQLQYDIFKQYNLLLEDPKFDLLYMSIDPLTQRRKYIEEDLNGGLDRISTTDVIKEFKKFLDTYDTNLSNYEKESESNI